VFFIVASPLATLDPYPPVTVLMDKYAKDVVWLTKKVSTDATSKLPITRMNKADFLGIHDIMPVETSAISKAVHLSRTNASDVSDIIASFCEVLGRVTIESNGCKLFSEEVLTFPHTGTFASVLPMMLLYYSDISIVLRSQDGCNHIPFTARIKYAYLDLSLRDMWDLKYLDLPDYKLCVRNGLLSSVWRTQ
jgi:hypothetical protein